jgi:prefoldin subunit 5
MTDTEELSEIKNQLMYLAASVSDLEDVPNILADILKELENIREEVKNLK